MSKWRWAAVILVLVVLLVVLAIFAVQTAPARRYVLARLQTSLAQQGIDFSASSLDYDLASLSLTLKHMVVRSTRAPELPPLALADRVHIELARAPLLRGAIRITDGEIVNPKLHVVFTAENKSNIPQSNTAKPTQPESSNPNLQVDRLKISGGSLLFEDFPKQFALDVPQWQMKVTGSGGVENVALETGNPGRVILQGRSLPIGGMWLETTTNFSSARVKRLELRLGESKLNLNGDIKNLSSPVLDLRAATELNLGELAAFGGVKQHVEGGARLDLTATGTAAKPLAAIHLSSQDLQLEDFRAISLSADATYNGEKQRARLITADLHSPEGAMHAEGDLALTPAAGQSMLHARLNNMNLQRVTRALDLKLRIASSASGAVNATWPGMDFNQADGRAVLHLTKLRNSPAKDTLPIAGDLVAVARAGQITVSIGGQPASESTASSEPRPRVRPVAYQWTGRIPHLQPAVWRVPAALPLASWLPPVSSAPLMNSSSAILAMMQAAQQDGGNASSMRALETLATLLRGNITVNENKQISGTLRATVTDLRAFQTRLNALRGLQGPLLNTALEGAAEIVAKLSGTVNKPRVDLTLTGPAWRVGDLQGVSVQVNALYRTDDLIIRNADVRWRDESASVTGAVGLKGKNPPINLDAQVKGLHLQSVFAAMQRTDVPAAGAVSLTAHVGGTQKNPAVTAELRSTGLEAYGERWGDLFADARLQNNVVYLSRLDLVKPSARGVGRLNATATYNLQSKAYELNAHSTGLNLEHLRLPNGKLVQGNINLDAQGSGTADDPRLSARLNATDLKIDRNHIGAVAAAADLANRLARLQLQTPNFNFATNVTVVTAAPYATQFTLNIANLNLSALPVQLPPDISGILSANARGALELKNPRAADITAEVPNLNLMVRGQNVRTTGPVVARYHNNVLNVQPSTILAGDSRVQIAGQLPLEAGAAPADLRVTGSFDLASAKQFAPSLANAAVAGQLSLDLLLRGSLKALEPTGSIALRNGFFQQAKDAPPVQDVTLEALIGNGVLTLRNAFARLASATFRASGEVPLGLIPAKLPMAVPRAQGPARFTADLAGLDLATLPNVPKNVTGLISAHLEAAAPRPNLNALTALLRFDQLRLTLSGVPLAQDAPSAFTVQNGVARVDHFRLVGPETALQLTGTAGLLPPRALDLSLNGNTDAALASLFTSGMQIRGPTQVQLALSGTAQAPLAQGFIAMQNGLVAMENPRVVGNNLDLRVNLNRDRVDLAHLTGALNGGALTGGGGFNFGKQGISNADLRIAAENVYFDFPEGLRTVSNLDTQLRSGEQNLLILGGQVNILEGSFRRDLNLQREVIDVLQGGEPSVTIVQARSPLLSRLRFNFGINTSSPIVFDNNIAKVAVDTKLRLVGGYYEPSVVGPVRLEEQGELYLNGKTFVIDRGVVTFVNERRIQPMVDLLARTSTNGYDISMLVQGMAGNIKTTLTSDPTLPQADIISVLVFGRPLQEVRGAEVNIAEQQALGFVAGGLGTALGNQIQQATGLSTVRVEPTLVANEANPSARLTIGEKITRALQFIYSMDLVNGSDRIWIGEYDITRRFVTRVTKQADNSYRFDFRHDLRFGGVPHATAFAKAPQRTVTSLDVAGDTFFPPKQLKDKLKIEPGHTYDFFKARKGMDRIRKLYREHDLLDAQPRLITQRQDSRVALRLNVDAGPKISFAYEGWSVSSGLRSRIRKIWQNGVFDAQRGQDAANAIRGALVREGYLQSRVTYEIPKPVSGQQRVLFRIQPGTRFHAVKLVFDGAQQVKPDHLSKALKDAKLRDQLLIRPDRVRKFLHDYYQDQGFLTAAISDPFAELDARTATGRIVVPVKEGPRYRIRSLKFQGNRAFPEERLRATSGLTEGINYQPSLRDPAMLNLQNLYWNNGYNDLNVQYTAVPDPKTGLVDVVFNVEEGKQGVVQQVVVRGTDQTSVGLVRSQTLLRPGLVLANDKLADTRSNLYETGAYQLVEIDPHPLRSGVVLSDHQEPLQLNINVEEVRPFQVRYGAYYDTDRGIGAISDFANYNSLGSARVIGLRTRYDKQLQDARLYFSQPLLRRFPVRSGAQLFFSRDVHAAFIDDHLGFSLDQQSKFRKNWIFEYSYRLERARVFNVALTGPINIPIGTGGNRARDLPAPPRPGGTGGFTVAPGVASASLRVAPLTGTLSHDTRDDVLDATRGQFMSHAFASGFTWLGSQQRYLKYYGQYYRFVALGKPVPEPFRHNVKKPRLIYAGAVRIGLAGGLGGQSLIQSERFFAGGGTTMRGFAQDEVGPRDPNGVPLGGNSEFILNNEVRFPMFSIFDGAAFMDIGNVYPNFTDFNPFDVRKSAGLGIRVHTPYFLLRADYGVKVDRRPGESLGKFFFTIGQAF